jgi:hypothetical protein
MSKLNDAREKIDLIADQVKAIYDLRRNQRVAEPDDRLDLISGAVAAMRALADAIEEVEGNAPIRAQIF